MKNEKIYKSEREVKYLFQKSYNISNELIIVFSAFQSEGVRPRYNYVKTLEGFNINKLFILDDFGARGSYYLCQNRDFSIERSVASLIHDIIKENKITKVMSCGSSKGGFAALYYGIKYNFSNIVVASPQYLLGDYIIDEAKKNEIVTFMAGNDEKEDQEFLNNIFPELLRETNNKPNIFIHVGKYETHYIKHVKQLVQKFDEKNISYILDLGDYSQHNDVVKHYPRLLKENVCKTFNYPKLIVSEVIKRNEQKKQYTIKVKSDSPQNEFAYYLYINGKKVQEIKYSKAKKIKFIIEQPGKYSIKVFVKNQFSKVYSVLQPTVFF